MPRKKMSERTLRLVITAKTDQVEGYVAELVERGVGVESLEHDLPQAKRLIAKLERAVTERAQLEAKSKLVDCIL